MPPPVFNQGKTNACVASSCLQVCECIINIEENGEYEDDFIDRVPSKQFVFDQVRRRYGKKSGLEPFDVFQFLMEVGTPQETMRPFLFKRNMYPSSLARKEERNEIRKGPRLEVDDFVEIYGSTPKQELDQVKKRLKVGPLVGCVLISERFLNYVDHVGDNVFKYQANENYFFKTNNFGEIEYDSHAMMILAYFDHPQHNLCFKVRNSWGVPWGHGGDAIITADSFQRNGFFYPIGPKWFDLASKVKKRVNTHIRFPSP